MTRQQFLTELNRLLQKLPEADRNDILFDYESHIQAAVDNGKTEEEAISDLGSPQSIANEILGTFSFKIAQVPSMSIYQRFDTISGRMIVLVRFR
jgi:uncharacterized membrane protein